MRWFRNKGTGVVEAWTDADLEQLAALIRAQGPTHLVSHEEVTSEVGGEGDTGGPLPDPITDTVNIDTSATPGEDALNANTDGAGFTVGSAGINGGVAPGATMNLGSHGGDFGLALNDSGLEIGPSGAADIANTMDGKLGFFGQTPASQPAAPVTLGDVIAALQALGLVAT